MQVTTALTDVLTPTAIALGNFDGLHRGHQEVLKPILEGKTSFFSEFYPSVVTFDPHPRVFFTGERRQLLTPLDEKVAILEKLGIKQLILLPFDQELAALSPKAFFEAILVQRLQAKQISIGQDFRFGYQRQGTAQTLRIFAAKFGISVNITALKTCDANIRISSSLIRQGLAKGEIQQVNQMLGRSYALVGKVSKGKQIGRTIGFPTANLAIAPDKLLPRYGVYGGWVSLEGMTPPILAAVNIGVKPTLGGLFPTVEVHLLDWQGDLYDQNLKVNLEIFIRPEQKFSGLNLLKQQIKTDCDQVRKTVQPQMSTLT